MLKTKTEYERRKRELARREYNRLYRNDRNVTQYNHTSFDSWYVDVFLVTAMWQTLADGEIGTEDQYNEDEYTSSYEDNTTSSYQEDSSSSYDSSSDDSSSYDSSDSSDF